MNEQMILAFAELSLGVWEEWTKNCNLATLSSALSPLLQTSLENWRADQSGTKHTPFHGERAGLWREGRRRHLSCPLAVVRRMKNTAHLVSGKAITPCTPKTLLSPGMAGPTATREASRLHPLLPHCQQGTAEKQNHTVAASTKLPWG